MLNVWFPPQDLLYWQIASLLPYPSQGVYLFSNAVGYISVEYIQLYIVMKM